MSCEKPEHVIGRHELQGRFPKWIDLSCKNYHDGGVRLVRSGQAQAVRLRTLIRQLS